MTCIKTCNFFYARLLVVDENFNIKTAEQVQVYFEVVIADGHYKVTSGIKGIDLLVKRISAEFLPSNHQSEHT